MIRIEHVNKTFTGKRIEVKALQDVSIAVEQGDIFGVIGLSGAGKSTLIRLVNRLERADDGKVIVAGSEVSELGEKELRALRKKIGMVFQQFNLLESRTVAQNVALPLKLAGWKRDAVKKRVAELLNFVELGEKAGEYVNRLSGGQKQRVGIARALATSPQILLCDEATSALDPRTTESILTLLKRVNRELGITILLITHQMNVIQRICNKVAVMEEGRVIEQGSVLEVFGRPVHPTTREFVRTVMNDRIPESIQRIVDQDNRHGQIEKLNFIGEAVNDPVIAMISEKTKVETNILCANVQEMQDSVMCLFLLRLVGEESEILRAEELIDAAGVIRERVTGEKLEGKKTEEKAENKPENKTETEVIAV